MVNGWIKGFCHTVASSYTMAGTVAPLDIARIPFKMEVTFQPIKSILCAYLIFKSRVGDLMC